VPARGKSTYKWPDCESNFPSGTVSGLGHRNGSALIEGHGYRRGFCLSHSKRNLSTRSLISERTESSEGRDSVDTSAQVNAVPIGKEFLST
jgi:hypothetical protein